ncbi:MAG: serine/threonine protein kinase [Anaerolineae bacterium]|nr:serine/threonine protein kinase [Anaerolineae bacterium]
MKGALVCGAQSSTLSPTLALSLAVLALVVLAIGGLGLRVLLHRRTGSRLAGEGRKPPGERADQSPVRPVRAPGGLKPSHVLASSTCIRCSANLRPGQTHCPRCHWPVLTIGNRYQVLRLLGKGGMSSVYLVRDRRISGQYLAAKEMSDATIATTEERKQAIDAFQQEAQLLARLEHANLPRVTEFLSQGDRHYLLMDCIDGETLQDLLAQRAAPFAEAEVLGWAGQLCSVLSYLHTRHPPVIFCDLKPGNIMLGRDGRLKLIDFGIARFFLQHWMASEPQRLGTPGYAPPEQYGQSQADARWDVYALGVTLHQLLTLHDPASTLFALPPVRRLNPAVSPRTQAAITQAIQPDPNHRFRSAAEMGHALGV